MAREALSTQSIPWNTRALPARIKRAAEVSLAEDRAVRRSPGAPQTEAGGRGVALQRAAAVPVVRV